MTKSFVKNWNDLPKTAFADGKLKVSGLRSEQGLVTFNWFDADYRTPSELEMQPVDRVVLTIDGSQLIEIDGEPFACAPRTAMHVPAGRRVHHRPLYGPVMSVHVYSFRPDIFSAVTSWQTDPPRRPAAALQPGAERALATAVRFEDLPTTPRYEGKMRKRGFRGEDSVTTINTIDRDFPKSATHKHDDFDQIMLLLDGDLTSVIDNAEFPGGHGTVMYAARHEMHGGWPINGNPPIVVDIFTPARADYMFLADHQTQFR